MRTLPAVPERLDRVTVALNGRPVILTWNARQALMRRLQHVQEVSRLRASFDAVGATRPVELTGNQRTALLLTLENWALDLDKFEAISPELLELRDELIADLHSAGRGRQASSTLTSSLTTHPGSARRAAARTTPRIPGRYQPGHAPRQIQTARELLIAVLDQTVQTQNLRRRRVVIVVRVELGEDHAVAVARK